MSSLENRIGKWEDQRDIKNIMGKYANCLILNKDNEVYDLFWSKERGDTALGFNEGWFSGSDAVKSYYRSQDSRIRTVSSLMQQRFSEQLQDRAEDELFGLGTFRAMPMYAPVIRVAEDGDTAKGLWYCMGSVGETYSCGPMSKWVWGYYAADFVREDGAWRIWHLLNVTELAVRCGSDWGAPVGALPALPEFSALDDFKDAVPNVKEKLWEHYTPERPLVSPPRLPEDYRTFAETFSYGPGAAPGSECAPSSVDAITGRGAAVSEEDEALMERVWDIENIKELMNRRVYYIAADRREDELSELWVADRAAQETASMGKNWGWYAGMDEIHRYYVDEHRERLEAQRQENGRKEYNVGNLYAHPATTGLVVLAEDGRSARGIWYAIAQETLAKPDGGAAGRWILEKIGADFLKEAEGWKIWHIMTAVDLSVGAGENYSLQPVYQDIKNDPIRQEFGNPTIEHLVHDNMFNWCDDYPPVPKPYQTFTADMGYGPEGYQEPVITGLRAGEGRNYK